MTAIATILAYIFTMFTIPAAQVNQSCTAMFRGGPQRTGKYEGNGFFADNRTIWRFRTESAVHSSPALQSNSLYIGSNDGFLYCLTAGSGELKWKFKATAGISSSPALANGLVYFQSNDNRFYALNIEDGKEKWQFMAGPDVPFDGRCTPCASEEGGWDYWASSPLTNGARVYFGSGDSHIYALDAATGKLHWRFKTGGRVRSSPTLYKGVIYVGSLDGKMYAINAEDGNLRWSFKTEGNQYFPVGEIQSTPAVDSGLVVFGSRDYYLYALDSDTGKLVWKTLHNQSWIIASPAIANNSVFVGSSDGQAVQKVDLATGKELWRTEVKSNVFSSPAVAGDFVYVGNSQGEIIGLDEKTGKIRMGRIIDSRITSSPIIANGVTYFGSENGNVYAVTGGSPPQR